MQSSEEFSQEYKKFKIKINNFITSTSFDKKTQEYEELFNQMASISPDDMKEMVEKSPDFITYRNKSLQVMEKLVLIHTELQELFAMDEVQLALKCHYNLAELDKEIAAKIKEAANLLHLYNELSEKGRNIVEKANDPFLSQGL